MASVTEHDASKSIRVAHANMSPRAALTDQEFAPTRACGPRAAARGADSLPSAPRTDSGVWPGQLGQEETLPQLGGAFETALQAPRHLGDEVRGAGLAEPGCPGLRQDLARTPRWLASQPWPRPRPAGLEVRTTADAVEATEWDGAQSQSSEPRSPFPEGLAWPSRRGTGLSSGTGPSSGDRPARLQGCGDRAKAFSLSCWARLREKPVRASRFWKGVPTSRERGWTGAPTEEPPARWLDVHGRWPVGARGAGPGEGLGVAEGVTPGQTPRSRGQRTL